MTAPKKSRRWTLAGHALTLVFIAVVAWLVATRARTINWDQVLASVQSYHPGTLLLAAGLTACAFTLYACYELLSHRYVHSKLPRLRVAAIAFVSYAFNLNFGSWVGGVGFRYRLYSRNGLRAGIITRILGMSLASNWIGYLVLAGLSLSTRMLPLPPNWALGAGALQVLGAVLLGAAASYLMLCAFSPKRVVRLRGHEIRLPPLRMALTQLALSLTKWMTVALVLFVLLRSTGVGYATVLAVLLTASIAGVLTHIPGGLGVIEAVFFAFLGDVVPEGRLLGALLTFRAIYYVLPVAAAIGVYILLEARARQEKHAHRHHAHA